MNNLKSFRLISVEKKSKTALCLTVIIFIFAGSDRGADILLVIN